MLFCSDAFKKWDVSPFFVCVGHLHFDSQDGYDREVGEKGPVIRGDISNFTNTTPARQISEILN
jgi:hypothetical protein